MPQKRMLLADFPRLPLDDHVVEKLQEDGVDWAHANGLVFRTPEEKERSDFCMTAPFALLPSPFPRELFQHAVDIQDVGFRASATAPIQETAKLYLKVAYDTHFLKDALKDVVKTDEFTKRMLHILDTITTEGVRQPFTLAIQRSDYMAHRDATCNDTCLKQVEVNNIASSMGAHAERVTRLHRRTLAELGYSRAEIESACPNNAPVDLIAEALHHAWTIYKKPDAAVLVVVEDVNQNQIDQRHVEYALADKGVPSTQIIRKTLTECASSLSLDASSNLVLDDDNTEIAVVYFRSGYAPYHYHGDSEWEVRLLMERSSAIKTPWIGLQLANTKKVQQVLAQDGMLERFVGNPRSAAKIRSTFAGLWPLESAESAKIIQYAKRHPDSFVLKPQLEGGAGNYYGGQVSAKLATLSDDEKAAHILMEKLKPEIVQNYMVRARQPVALADCVGELGVYGYAHSAGPDAHITAKTGGHILRTKRVDTDEGGVAVGASVIDSPFLYDFIDDCDKPKSQQ